MSKQQVMEAMAEDRTLTQEEEHDIFYYIQEEQDKEVRDTFVMKNDGLVHYFIKPYVLLSPGDEEDYYQEGIIGMMKAVKLFKPDMEMKFSTYAGWWIKQAVSRYQMDTGRNIRIPVHLQELMRKIIALQKANELNGKTLSAKEIAKEVDAPLETVNMALQQIEHKNICSLDSPIEMDDHGGSELGDFIEDNRSKREQDIFEVRNDLENFLASVPKIPTRNVGGNRLAVTNRELEVIRLRYGLDNDRPITLEEIAKVLGITKERVRQIEQRGLHKLRVHARKTMRDYESEVF